MKKKDVLFLSQVFYPANNSSANYTYDISSYFASLGYSVGVLCGEPKEYYSEPSVPSKETVSGMEVKRIKYASASRSKKFGRIINFLSFNLRVCLHMKEIKHYKCVVVYSNPPILPVAALLAKKLYDVDIIFVSYDVYPEIACAMDYISPNGMIAKLMRKINSKIFVSSSAVVAITNEMKNFLRYNRKTKAEDNIRVIPNWAHEELVGSCDKSLSLNKKFGISDDKFVVAYLGNMGVCQGVETLIDAAKKLQNNDNIHFLLVGYGSKKPLIEKTVEEENLKNITVGDLLSPKEFTSVVSSVSCAVVALENGLCGTCAPSKYYSYLYAGKPVISIAEKDSFLAKEAAEKEIGFSVEPGCSDELADKILKLAGDKNLCKNMGENAKELYNEKYSFDIAKEKYKEIIEAIN